ncbi:MAG: aldehyde dehydrogenase family protein, partial [Pseudomonadales bacterium]|nr:aldehyde dehydrogenase family protein [Pseudomonadales bacterium]
MNKNSLKTISPVDGSLYVEREYATPTTIQASLADARRAAISIAALPISERIAICQRALNYFDEHRNTIAEQISWQMGRPIAHSGGEVSGVIERARYMMDIAEVSLADIVPKPSAGFKRFVRKQPLGTVLVVAPWNYPLLTTTNAVFPALLAGNSVILKPSAQTPLAAEHFAAAFDEAGLPAGGLQCLHLDHAATSRLIEQKGVDFVCFTGSVEAGRRIAMTAAQRFIGAGLELGGKDPAYVMPDANIDEAVAQLVDGAFFNAGQSCCGIERIYVHQHLYKDFVENYSEAVKALKLGNPLDTGTTLGPVAKQAAAKFIREQISAAVNQGAKGTLTASNFQADDQNGCYLAPQVLINVSHEMSIMRDESFGPVVG